jgi:hypothetical protein
MGWASPEAACNYRWWYGCLSRHPGLISGLAAVTYAPVSTVTSFSALPIQPWVTKRGSALPVMTVNACRWGLNADASFDLYGRSSFFSRYWVVPPFCFPDVTRSPLIFLEVSVFPLEAFRHDDGAGHLLPLFHMATYPKWFVHLQFQDCDCLASLRRWSPVLWDVA